MGESASEKFRKDHAISREVWADRPFERYRRDAGEAERIKGLYDGSGLRPGQLGDITKIVMNERDGCAGGFVIHRHQARAVEAGTVYPQLRPDEPVARELVYHWHADAAPTEALLRPTKKGPNPVPADRIYLRPAKGWGPSIQEHIKKGDDGRPAHEDENLHRGVNCQELHSHQVLAKYLFPSSLLKDIEGDHRHIDMTLESLVTHIQAEHKKDDEAGFPHPYAWHLYKRTVKDRERPLAQRLDVEPAFYELLDKSPVVYFGIEGSVKGSALTSARVPTFTVPSVTMWPANELDAFVDRYLMGKVVVIVPDNDWFDNERVVAQAFLCRTYLRRRAERGRGFSVLTLIAAPPDAGLDENGKYVKVGVDDYLARGGDLLDMDVIDRDAPIDMYYEWIVERLPRKGPRARKAAWIDKLVVALEGFALHAKDGRVQLPQATLAGVMGLHPKDVERAARDLMACGAITSDRDPAVRQGVYTPYGHGRGHYDPLGLEFAHRTTFTIADDLQVLDQGKTLREALDLHPRLLEYWGAAQYYDRLSGQGVATAVGKAFREALPA